MRILILHGWLLEGAGSNVAAARLSEVFRAAGHDVLLLCQERHPERHAWIDASGTVAAAGVSDLRPNPTAVAGPGRCVLLRPEIGSLLPVFVVDEYEGFQVKTFIDLTEEELDEYLGRNVDALRAAAAWHRPEAAFAGHAVPGPEIARRALGPGAYVGRIHGSDLEYAVRPQARYRGLAASGLGASRAVVGASAEVLERCVRLVPEARGLTRVVRPGVDVAAFRPMPRQAALLDVAARLELDPDTGRGRPSSHDALVARAIGTGGLAELDRLADTYDRGVPDPDAAARLRELARGERPLVGYLGKLIPQKGVELLLEGATLAEHDVDVLVVGFGTHRDRLEAIAMQLPGGRRVVFTGRLDHRYAPGVLAAMDVLVIPSILEEAFGLVAAEGAAAGALPLAARHSGLAEVASELEREVGRPGLFSFEPGRGAARAIAEGIDRIIGLPADERRELGSRLNAFVTREWTWEQSAARLLDAARGG
jgi:glycosyltransferase involved in cell wall biosynthesis